MTNEEMKLQTKKRIAESLKKIMRTKSFSRITVSEVIKDCNINRNTFYYHFQDIYALLTWIFEEEAIGIIKHFDLLTDYQEAIDFVMDYMENNDYIVNCANDSACRDELKRFLHKDFTSVTKMLFDRAEEVSGKTLEPFFKSFVVQFYTEAITGMLINWVNDRNNYTREQITLYMEKIIETTIRNIIEQQ